MIIPLDKLVSHEKNNYVMTCAIIKRAAQITMTGVNDPAEDGQKVVSVAIKQILTGQVNFRQEE